MTHFTIHIFGYGETQINSKELSIKVSTDTLSSITPLIEAIFSKKPVGNPSLISPVHAINIFNYDDVRWQSKDFFNVKDDAELKPLIDALIAELQLAKDTVVPEVV